MGCFGPTCQGSVSANTTLGGKEEKRKKNHVGARRCVHVNKHLLWRKNKNSRISNHVQCMEVKTRKRLTRGRPMATTGAYGTVHYFKKKDWFAEIL